MKKKQLVGLIKRKNPYLSLNTIKWVLEAALKSIAETLKSKESITINGFGEFYVKRSGVKRVYDFKSRDYAPYRGKFNVKFKPSQKLKARVNEGEDAGFRPAESAGDTRAELPDGGL